MRSLYLEFSGIIGVLAFLNQLWSYAPIERTILVGFGVGVTLYLVLLLADTTIHRILARAPELANDAVAPSGEGRGSSKSEDTSKKAKVAAA